MSLKSRLKEQRENKHLNLTYEETDCDLLAYFKYNRHTDSLEVYGHDRIFAEKNGIYTQINMKFSSKEAYINEIKRICNLYDKTLDENNPNIIINVQDNVTINIISFPIAKTEPYVSLKRNKIPAKDNYRDNSALSREMLLYLQECLRKKANIFITGEAQTDKTFIFNIIQDLLKEDSRVILIDDGHKIEPMTLQNLYLSQQVLDNFTNIKYDYAFCTGLLTENVIKVFKLIIEGNNGFVVSLPIKNGLDTLLAVRNLILLSNNNLFDENADFISASAIDVLISVETVENTGITISKISEVAKNKNGENYLKDIFIRNINGNCYLTGNNSKYLIHDNNSTIVAKDDFEENKKHSYISSAAEPIENSSNNKLREKIKKLKQFKKFESLNTYNVQNKEQENIKIDTISNEDKNSDEDATEVLIQRKPKDPLRKNIQTIPFSKNNQNELSGDYNLPESPEDTNVETKEQENIQNQSEYEISKSEISDYNDSSSKQAPLEDEEADNNRIDTADINIKQPVNNILEDDTDKEDEISSNYSDDISFEQRMPNNNPEHFDEEPREIEEYDNFENQNETITEDIDNSSGEYIEDDDEYYYSDNEEQEYNTQEENSMQIVEEPELFSEIKDVDINNSDNEADDIPDDI